MAIQTAPWYAVAGELYCPQCEAILERITVLTKQTRLHTKLDGYAICSFSCPLNDCGWKSGDILVKFDLGADFTEADEPEAEREAPSIIIPTVEEVQTLSVKAKPLASKIIDLPPPDPVEIKELEKYVIENSPNNLNLKDGMVLRRKLEKREMPGLAEGEVVGIVRLIYSDGNSTKPGAFNFNQGEASFMTTNGLPDMKEAMVKIKASIAGDLKLTNEHPRRAPVAAPKFNKAGSRARGICVFKPGILSL